MVVMAGWGRLDMLLSWAGFGIALAFYIPVIVAVYFIAESRGESGFMWSLFCICVPVISVLIFIIWSLMVRYGSIKPKMKNTGAFDSPDMSLSRQRLRGGPHFVGKSYDEIEKLISTNDWDGAESLINSYLEDAERSMNGPVIADMIAYRERIKKGRRA